MNLYYSKSAIAELFQVVTGSQTILVGTEKLSKSIVEN